LRLRLLGLAEVGPDLEPCFGGKALGLARLLAAGARVPPGFAVEAGTRPPAEWAAADRASFLAEVGALLPGGPLAVRSSAPGEDSAARSFAGLFESVLGVVTAEAALEAAARCIASGAGPRVLAYAGTARPVGLIVQRLVPARAAGVCFTVDPQGRDGACLVEAAAGLGDALVSGRTEPERWRVYASSALGTLEPQRQGGPAVLPEGLVRTVAAEARRLAERLGQPLDLEWAWDGNEIVWLQARPITVAVAPEPLAVERFDPDVDDGPVTVWANWNVRETMPDPFTPLAWGIWRESLLPAVLAPLLGVPADAPIFPKVMAIDLVQGRVHWNMNGLEATWLGAFFRRGALRRMDAQAAEVAAELRARGVLRPRRVKGAQWVLLRGFLTNLVHRGGVSSALRPERVLASLRLSAEAVRARPRLATLDEGALFRELSLFDHAEMESLRQAQHALGLAFLIVVMADSAFRRYPEAAERLASGLPGNPTTEIALGIDELVEAARPLAAAFAAPGDPRPRLAQDAEGRAWLARLQGFLERFGQRAPGEFDLAVPRWAEDPWMIVELVRTGLRAPAGDRATDRLARQAAERERVVAAVVSQAPFWKRPWLRLWARLVAAYMPLREAPKHYAMHAFARIRNAALELGGRLAGRGVLAQAADIFFLEWSEARDLAEGKPPTQGLRERVRERQARHGRFRALPRPHFVRSDGVPVIEEEPGPGPDGSLRGDGVSAGTATGAVRILREPDPRAMGDGDVIVVTLADPGWTPLFPRAAAVVMEVGGALCHAAIVARELGIPAVFGVAGATRLLRDGQQVRVDGRAGTVTPLGEV
jgi:pyruvate,water dikinase